MDYDNLDDLLTGISSFGDGNGPSDPTSPYLTKAIQIAGEELLRDYIRSKIYESYSPLPGGWIGRKTYQRRYDLLNSIKSEVDDDGSVWIYVDDAKIDGPVGNNARKKWNDAGDPAGAFLELLASRNQGIWSYSGHGFPRPVITQAQATVDGRTADSAEFWSRVNSML